MVGIFCCWYQRLYPPLCFAGFRAWLPTAGGNHVYHRHGSRWSRSDSLLVRPDGRAAASMLATRLPATRPASRPAVRWSASRSATRKKFRNHKKHECATMMISHGAISKFCKINLPCRVFWHKDARKLEIVAQLSPTRAILLGFWHYGVHN